MAKKSKKTKKTDAPKTPREIRGLALFCITLGIFLSLVSFATGQTSNNALGLIGGVVGKTFHGLLGLGSYLFCLFLGWIAWRLMFNKSLNHLIVKSFYAVLTLLSVGILLSLIEDQLPSVAAWIGQTFYPGLWIKKFKYHLGGAPFYYIYHDLPSLSLFHLFNSLGIALVFSGTLLACIFYFTKLSPLHIFYWVRSAWIRWQEMRAAAGNKAPLPAMPTKQVRTTVAEPAAEAKKESDFLRFVKLRIPGFSSSQNPGAPTSQELLAIQPESNPKVRPSISRKAMPDESGPHEKEKVLERIPDKAAPTIPASIPAPVPTPAKKRENALAAQRVYNGDFSSFHLPSPPMLTSPKKVDQSSLKKDLKRQAEVLEETLQSFGIEAKVGQINCGPTITSFEVHPSIGVKVQKIKALENDIALNMEAKSIRIIAPIPGKAAVGIEVPNAQPQEVAFKDMLTAYQEAGKKFHIPILLGKAVNGDFVMSDLTKMPHCIIAGATGSGKSVCINTIVMSILMNARPDEIKLVMVDPKKVELTPYTRLPHMLAPVITEPQGACAALNWMVKEMESRYEILKLIGVRNIEAFNTRTINPELEAEVGREVPAKFPYIVGIIDELADLMMVASSDIETPIARIAQMARAVGIHLVLATQRPSREVITGLIKANFPTRISFKVASRINSQIVLDETGAESLLGNGDMLFLPPGSSHLVRAQGAFIRDEDINAVVKFICDQAPPNYVIASFDRLGHISEDDLNSDEPEDDLYTSAVDVILGTGNASTTFLQRKLKIGYARAASLIDRMESKGILGPAEGSKPRKILAARRAVEEQNSALGVIEEDPE